jgi:Protein of unknown function (DUF1566)
MRRNSLPRCFAFVAVLLGIIWADPSQANAPTDQYVISNGTVFDTKSQLTWEQEPTVGLSTFNEAMMYCKNLPLTGGNWRLPSMKELQTIIDETHIDPSIDEIAFPQTPLDLYWSSSVWAGDATQAWAVRFDYASTNFYPKNDLYYVRCVR